jgi:hypothetical protein
MKWRRRLRSLSSSPAVAARAASKTKRPAASPSDARGAKKPASTTAARGLGRKSVIQVLFNMRVPRARVPGKASMLRDRSER